MFCPQCGDSLPENSRYCKRCGAQLGTASQAVESGDDCEITGPLPNIQAALEEYEKTVQLYDPDEAEEGGTPEPFCDSNQVEEYEKTVLLYDPDEEDEDEAAEPAADSDDRDELEATTPPSDSGNQEEYEKTVLLYDPDQIEDYEKTGPLSVSEEASEDEITWLLPDSEDADESGFVSTVSNSNNKIKSLASLASGWRLPLFIGGAVALVGVLLIVVLAALGMFDEKDTQQTGGEGAVSTQASTSAESADESGESSESGNAVSNSATAESAASEEMVMIAANGVPFARAQLYDGTLYAGSVRTAAGFEPVTTIAGAQQPPAPAERFTFANGCFYYVELREDVPANSAVDFGTKAVELREVNLETKEESVLASDVSASSGVCYADGYLVYMRATNERDSVGVIDVQTRDSKAISLGNEGARCVLCGVRNGQAIIATSRIDQKNRIYACPLGGGRAREIMAFASNEALMAACDDMMITSNKNVVTGYDLEGDQIWTTQLTVKGLDAGSLCYAEGVLYSVDVGSSGPKSIVSIDVESGASRAYLTSVQDELTLLYADDVSLYFCAVAAEEAEDSSDADQDQAPSDDSSDGDSEEEDVRGYETYVLNLSSGSIRAL